MNNPMEQVAEYLGMNPLGPSLMDWTDFWTTSAIFRRDAFDELAGKVEDVAICGRPRRPCRELVRVEEELWKIEISRPSWLSIELYFVE
ncbi:hypothetical protein NQ318_017544 [Aromia moschata]|uniref:Sulfotransferase n=1 Tax=Aromia moschata TaxID=1265417 RepID=A0AAV8Z066_9CUCU|nr:hypothetical protein NQ318_017544 [Aromia moschata]